MNSCNCDCEYEDNGKCMFCESGYQCRILKELGAELTLANDEDSLFAMSI